MKTTHHLLAAIGFGLASLTANATLIDFESGLDPLFTYTGVGAYSSGCGSCFAGTGYQSVLDSTPSSGAVFNPFEASPSLFTLSGSGTFDLTSFVIAGAWGNQTLTVEGLLNNAVVTTTGVAVTPVASLVSLNWTGIDQLRISIDPNGYTDTDPNDTGSGQHWALDNLTINENSVPEPGTLLLVGAGLAAAGLRRRAGRHR